MTMFGISHYFVSLSQKYTIQECTKLKMEYFYENSITFDLILYIGVPITF